MKTFTDTFSTEYYLSCSQCHKIYSSKVLNTFAPCCNQPLEVEYSYAGHLSKDSIDLQKNNMWRYAKMLPVFDPENVITLGEGMTPIIKVSNLSVKNGFSSLYIKDESLNPTGSFKARGLSMAVSKAKELNIQSCIIPTAGNAGGALAAYCAKAGIACTVVMPCHTPEVFKYECQLYGASLVLIDGLINDCAKIVEQMKSGKKMFDVSTLKEPYRLEGKKTMGYEIAEQMKWKLPDIIIYPAGGGTGLIGIWKAFKEMVRMGWITTALPKMIAVQALNCNPLERAMKDPVGWKDSFVPKPSLANGLVVPYPFGMDMMKKVLSESGGTVVSVSEEEILEGVKEFSLNEGMLLSPEGAATWKALLKLTERDIIKRSENILLLNTGTGYKYLQHIFRNYKSNASADFTVN
jgi:threonine synthase